MPSMECMSARVSISAAVDDELTASEQRLSSFMTARILQWPYTLPDNVIVALETDGTH